MVFVRKVVDSKWPDSYDGKSDIDADCLGDVRTTDNMLSIWSIEDNDDVIRVASIIAANSDSDISSKTRLVFFSDSDLKIRKLDFEQHAPNNKILINMGSASHYDIQKMKIKNVYSFARLIATKYTLENVYTVDRKNVVKVLANSCIKKEFNISDIKSESFRRRIESEMAILSPSKG